MELCTASEGIQRAEKSYYAPFSLGRSATHGQADACVRTFTSHAAFQVRTARAVAQSEKVSGRTRRRKVVAHSVSGPVTRPGIRSYLLWVRTPIDNADNGKMQVTIDLEKRGVAQRNHLLHHLQSSISLISSAGQGPRTTHRGHC